MLQKGYEKYKGGTFRVPELSRWHVLVTGKSLVDELRKANDSDLNFVEALIEVLHIDYTFGHEVYNNPYHTLVIHTSLTRSLGVLYPDVRDELVQASTDLIPLSDEWKTIRAFDTIMQIICRTSNRIFVGLPLCRDPEFLKLNVAFTLETVKAGMLLDLVPWFMRRFVTNLTSVETMKRRGEDMLRPVIQERLRLMAEHGEDWAEKPNDMLSWLIEKGPKDEQLIPSVTLRILIINQAAIHTSTMMFSHVLYHLAASPEYQAELREEIDRIVAEDGWNKESLAKMIKVDSFVKEIARYQGLSSNYTFSDGTFIPKGTLVSATSRAAHFDEENYDNPDAFDPWRFANMETEGSEVLRNQVVNAHPEFLTFGLGRHACPGRFFASTELKSVLANFVYTYDMKMPKEGVVPSPTWFMTNIVPSRTADVMFRKRQN
ncbi:hypothetical protein EUX98_g7079 [Antrodiella citrinella]|uniref:Cytochrome P450 n=1 Tax=Antrodiella citrinella TaxID=2447956 RepID=A0A4S4MUV4_9APHY|nr:hypothetical protein EUX98_g7079 [Antrodiella citrinella]